MVLLVSLREGDRVPANRLAVAEHAPTKEPVGSSNAFDFLKLIFYSMKFSLSSVLLMIFTQVATAQSNLFIAGANRVDFEADGLFSDDVNIVSSSLRFEQTRGSWNFSGSFGHLEHHVDYSPPIAGADPLSFRDESAQLFDLSVEKVINSNLTLSASASYSQGFLDHRSVWISEFYDLSFSSVPGYEEADPRNYSATIGGVWDYKPGVGSLSVSLTQANAEIVPGWAIEFDPAVGFPELIASEDEVGTFSGTLSWNTTFAKRFRSNQTIRIGRTDGRRIFTQLQSEFSYAVSDRLSARLQIGGAHEDPTFLARFAGIGLVYDVNPQWQLNFNFRYYEDTGEISSTAFTPAAPAVTNRELSSGLRWSNGTTSVLVSAGYYQTDYEGVENSGNREFLNLYQDRDFLATRFAITHKF